MKKTTHLVLFLILFIAALFAMYKPSSIVATVNENTTQKVIANRTKRLSHLRFSPATTNRGFLEPSVNADQIQPVKSYPQPPVEQKSTITINVPENTENKIIVPVSVISEKPVTPPPAPTPVPTPTPTPTPAPVNTTQTPLPPPPAPKPVATCTTGSFNDQFLCLINNYRASKGLNALVYDQALNATAAYHSNWMDVNKTMSHIGENGSRFYERCALFDVKCDGENVAYGYTSAKSLFNAWKASPGHDANMVGTHTKMGLAIIGLYSTLLLR